jgi:DNA-binding SARP family transcriptional activator
VLSLLGGFDMFVDAALVRLPMGAQKLLAYLALQERVSASRVVAAEHIWADSRRSRAFANLRTALWQSRAVGGLDLIQKNGDRLSLSAGVYVDFNSALGRARDLSIRSGPDLSGVGDHDDGIRDLSQGLLPSWSDEWLLLDRERWDQVRLHTLELLAHRLMAAEKYLAAIEAALAAVAIEPVRETAHRMVIQVYLAQGNGACALKHYQRYRSLVQYELGVSPSRQMSQLVQPLLTGLPKIMSTRAIESGA